LESLLFDDFFKRGLLVFSGSISFSYVASAIHKAQPGWRRVIAQAVLWGIPTPAFSTALAFFDGYRSEIVPANLIQAQVIRHISYGMPWLTGHFSATISVPIPSACYPAKKIRDSEPTRISVRT
jgi:hypothetical protein